MENEKFREKLGCMTVKELKEECKKRKARVQGRKAELIDRLKQIIINN